MKKEPGRADFECFTDCVSPKGVAIEKMMRFSSGMSYILWSAKT